MANTNQQEFAPCVHTLLSFSPSPVATSSITTQKWLVPRLDDSGGERLVKHRAHANAPGGLGAQRRHKSILMTPTCPAMDTDDAPERRQLESKQPARAAVLRSCAMIYQKFYLFINIWNLL